MYDIFSYIRYFHWQSVLDVLLVAYLFYQCALWVRGSRALLAAVGLAVVGGIALLAHWSGLILAGWLFQSLWSVIWLILIIVFQPELRRILERLSLLDLVRGRRSTLQREPKFLRQALRAKQVARPNEHVFFGRSTLAESIHKRCLLARDPLLGPR